MNIKINGTTVNVEENDELEVATDVAATEPAMEEVIETLEAKETIGSKIRNLPWWKKVVAVVGAAAGGAYIVSKLGGHDEVDDEDEDETDEDEDNEEE